jgi:hypothetical protein
VLRTLVDQAIYGRARLGAGSLVIWVEGEPHDGLGAEPVLLEAVSCFASGRGFESVERFGQDSRRIFAGIIDLGIWRQSLLDAMLACEGD